MILTKRRTPTTGLTLVFCAVLAVLIVFPSVSQAVTIQFIHWYAPEDGLGQALNELIEAFEAEHPDIEVEAQFVPFSEFRSKVLVQLVAGVTYDVTMVSGYWFGDFTEMDLFLPFDDWSEAASITIDDFYPESAQQAYLNGRYYAVPFAGGPQRALWYNNRVLAESGMDPTLLAGTFDDFKEAARKLSADCDGDGQTDRYGVNTDYGAIENFAVANGQELVSTDGTRVLWNADRFVEAFEMMAQLDAAGFAREYNAGHFMGGLGVMYLDGPWHRLQLQASGDDFQMTYFPLNSPEGKYLHSADLLAINRSVLSSEEKLVAAAKFIGFLASAEIQSAWAIQTGFPPMNVSAIRMPEYLDFVRENRAQWVATDMMQNLYAYPAIPLAEPVRSILIQWARRSIQGGLAPANALEQATQEANMRLADFFAY